MKSPYLVLIVGIIVAFISLIANLVSAPRYEFLFITVVSCDLIALTCLWYLLRLDGWRAIAAMPIGVIALYTIADVALRFFLGMRVLDIF